MSDDLLREYERTRYVVSHVDGGRYRVHEGHIGPGKAADTLGMARREFIEYASSLGIPYFDMTEDEWEDERKRSDLL